MFALRKPMASATGLAVLLLCGGSVHAQGAGDVAVSREVSLFRVPVTSVLDTPPTKAVSREISLYRLDPTPPANLAVTSVTTSGLSCGTGGGLLSGETISVTYTVTNLGSGPSTGTWHDSIFFTSAPTLGPGLSGETLLGTFPLVSPLSSGGSYTRTVTVTLPEDLTGCRYIGVSADTRPLGSFLVGQQYDVNETNELDNAGFSSGFQIELAPQPDLVSATPSQELDSVSGQSLTVSYILENAGTAPTDVGTWTDRVHLSADTNPVISPGDILLGVSARSGAALPGGTADASRAITGTLPLLHSGTVFSGTWNLKLSVDVDDQVSEAGVGGEANLFILGTVMVGAVLGANIAASIDTLATDTAWTPGHPASIAWSGSISSPLEVGVPQVWVDRVRLSGAPGGDRDLAFRSQTTVVATGSGAVTVESYAATRTFFVPNDLAEGTYTLHVDLNIDDGLYEGPFDNPALDTASIPVMVTFDPTNLLPEVNFDATPLPASGAVGTPIALRWRVTNAGTRETPVAEWTDRVRLVGGGEDLLLATVPRDGVLAAGASYVATATALVPPVPAGSYSLVFRTDVTDAVYEQAPGEGDNEVSAAFVVTGELSDLEVGSISATPPSPSAGTSLAVDWSVTNAGDAATNAALWIDRIYLSTDAALDAGDRFIGERARSGKLGSLESYGASASLGIPATLSGPHHVIVVTDAGGSGGSVYEGDESNNVAASAATVDIQALPESNLTVTAVTAPSSGVSGQPFTVSWTVENLGPGDPLPANWSDSVYLSEDTVFDPSDLHLRAVPHGGGLAVGTSYPVSVSAIPPLGVAGTRFVFIVTDAGGIVAEADEADNALRAAGAIELTLPDPGDLRVLTVTAPASTPIGSETSLNWRLENQDLGGLAAAVNGFWSDALFLSVDDAWSPDDILLGESAGGSVALPEGAFLDRFAAFTYPPVLGPRHVIVRADSGQNIPEVDEENNLGASIGTIEGTATALAAEFPGDPPAGQSGTMLAGEFRAYVVPALAAGETVELQFLHSSPGAWTELFARFGDLPTDDVYDATGHAPGTPQQFARLDDIPGGDLYVLVRVNGTITDPNTLVRARLLPLLVESAAPERIGDTGRVTLDIRGANFEPGVALRLEGPGATVLTPRKLVRVGGGRLVAEFELAGPPLGVYDIIATNPDATEATGAGLVTIEPVIPPVVTIAINEPPPYRAGGFATVTLQVRNLGNVDAPYLALHERTPAVGARAIESIASSAPFTLARADGSLLLSSALVRSLPPGRDATLTTTYRLEAEPGEFIAQRAATLLERDEWIGLQAAHAEELRLALLEDPTQIPAAEFAALQPLLADPIAWRDSWFADLVAVELLDAEDLASAGVAPALGTADPACPETAFSGSIASALATFEASSSAAAFSALPPDELLVALEAGSEPLWDASSCATVEIRTAIDPNEKEQPSGVDEAKWIALSTPIVYVLHFENLVDPEFGAPAARVEIRDPLDDALDPSSVRLGSFAVNGEIYSVPENRNFYQTTLDLTATRGVYLSVTAGVDAATREVYFTFKSLDPLTGLAPRDSTVGFLPPSEGLGPGTGAVSFEVQASSSLAGSPPVDLPNGGGIIFDNNAAIELEPVHNTIDPSAPSSDLVAGLGALDESVILDWSADDGADASGLKDYDLYVREASGSGLQPGAGSGTLEPLLLATELTSFEYVGEPGATYEFYLLARDRAGNVETIGLPDAIVTIPPDLPEITADPVSAQVCEGGSATFSVVAEGGGTLEYQWRIGGNEIPGANSPELSIDPVTSEDAGLYDVVVSNGGGSVTSGAALLTVLALPAIAEPPAGGAVCLGEPISLDVIATGAAPLGYQWFLDGAILPGATGPSLAIAAALAADEGVYSVEVTNACGTVVSAAAAIDVLAPPAIAADPAPQSVCPGGVATFAATASGDPSPDLQWLRDGIEIAGATADTLVIDPVSPADAAEYSLRATNSCGTATSAPALLLVLAPPAAAIVEGGVTACAGDSFTLTGLASGDPAPQLQWTLDDVPILDADGSSYTVANAGPSDAGEYRLVATNACGTATSPPVAVEVDSAPAELAPLADASPCAGEAVVLSAQVAADPPPTYAWTRDGAPLAESGPTLTIAAAAAGDSGNYCVTATNPCGAIALCATVTVRLAPTIVIAPAPLSVCEGEVAAFSVVADGAGPLAYEWLFDGTPIAGEESDQLILVSVGAAAAGDYAVTVTGACGEVTSPAATLAVLAADLLECDCNGNGILDATDIAGGTSLDTDGDGVPDECQAEFRRADANGDGAVDIGDGIAMLSFLFGGTAVGCLDALDVNDSAVVDIADPISALAWLFSGGPPPPPPFSECGLDPTADAIVCEMYASCP